MQDNKTLHVSFGEATKIALRRKANRMSMFYRSQLTKHAAVCGGCPCWPDAVYCGPE